MNILQRVVKASKDTEQARSHDHEAAARAAIATLFNWLGDPPQPVVDVAVVSANSDAATCRRIWTTILAEMRKEAGF